MSAGKDKRVLITNYVHPYLIKSLNELGCQVCYDQNYDPQMIPQDIGQLEGIVINSKIKLFKEQIDLAKNLKFIARLGSGLEIIDVDYAKQKGIAVFSAPEGNRNAVAEHSLGMLLSLANNLIKGDREVRQKKWDREGTRGFEIEGKTIGIIGLGNTGETFARKLSGWAQTVYYYDKYRLDNCNELNYLQKVSLKDLQKEADIISLHLPLTEETRGLVDHSFIHACKDGMILINTSRGQIVKTLDLICALESGKMGGACLDVFENEKPFSFSAEENQLYTRLFKMENVILSPHVAGWTNESLFKIAKYLIKKIRTTI